MFWIFYIWFGLEPTILFVTGMSIFKGITEYSNFLWVKKEELPTVRHR
jgi:hypothetical protein